MPARVPLDVDLEDRLLYGLTPMRLAYAVAALLAAFATWSSPWAPSPVRAAAALVIVGLGAAVSWGRWRGIPADGWAVDLVLFILRTHRVVWAAPRMGRPWLKPFSSPPPTGARRVMLP